jgi:tRNA dimethylallyltransferase
MFTLSACPPASQLASASNNPAVILEPFLLCSATQKPSLHRKWFRWSVRAKVAVDEGGRTRLQLTDCPPAEKTNGIEISGRCPPRLEFAGRIDHGDCSIVKPAVRTQTSARVIVIAGPTAVGKTRVALALAKQVGGEIISADSVQVSNCMCVSQLGPLLQQHQGLEWPIMSFCSPHSLT